MLRPKGIEMTEAEKREMLEMAAKAAGYAVQFIDGSDVGRWKPSARSERIFWNPLADDGDAFRLATRLLLTIYHAEMAVIVKHKRYSWEWMGEVVNEDTGDLDASARLVITRAAAEIGRQMQSAEGNKEGTR